MSNHGPRPIEIFRTRITPDIWGNFATFKNSDLDDQMLDSEVTYWEARGVKVTMMK
jgi:hypothetical protein